MLTGLEWVDQAVGTVRSVLRRELCPFCFEYFRMSEVPFRCGSPPAICAPVPDAVLGSKWNDSRPKGKVIPPAGYARDRVCPACSHKTRKRLCPHCHQELPHTTGDFPNYIFAIIGAKGAGKSHYLPVLIEQIKNGVGPDLGMLLEPLNDDTIQRYRDDFYTPIFTRHQTLIATRSALANVTARLPLVFSLLFTSTRRGGGRKIDKAVTLAFFDTAGEDLHAQDVMATVNKYIYRSNGIILLLDPLQVDGIRARLPTGQPLPPKDAETSDIIIRVSNLVHAGRGTPQDSPIDIPLAVAVSKFDAIESLIDRQARILAAPNHCSGFDLADFQAVDGEMRSHIADWECRMIIEQVETRYRRHAFFGLSALGASPKGTTLSTVFPKRVEDPFLWLLHVNGLIKPRK